MIGAWFRDFATSLFGTAQLAILYLRASEARPGQRLQGMHNVLQSEIMDGIKVPLVLLTLRVGILTNRCAVSGRCCSSPIQNHSRGH
jgi:hypothetical protein